MHIPRAWARAEADAKHDGRSFRISVWGWGDDDSAARVSAKERLARAMDRVRRGEPLPRGYGYGNRPLREEILQRLDDGAVLTRNSYGAKVLNVARLVFLDIDLAPLSLVGVLRKLFAGRGAEAEALGKLREGLARYNRASFRIYRTASGLRAMALDRELDPAGREAQDLMRATGTDPAFARLCVAQKSFRARLTPKPWRCGSRPPPGVYPREDADMRRRFAAWLADYEKRSARYATCRYLETFGSSGPRGAAARCLELHDRETRAGADLPLA